MSARTIMRLDALFEWTLGALLVVAWPLGWFELAGWEGWPAALVGVALIGAGVWIWTAPATRSMLRLLAAVNAIGAIIFAGWLLLWFDDFDPAGATLTALTAAILALIALAEWSIARSPASAP